MSENLGQVCELAIRVSHKVHRALGVALRKVNIDLAPNQALFLYRLGGEVVGGQDIMRLGVYYGSNSHYPIRVMAERGYLTVVTPTTDRRRISITATGKGREVQRFVEQFYQSFTPNLNTAEVLVELLESMDSNLSREYHV